jgi:hypothetical protein
MMNEIIDEIYDEIHAELPHLVDFSMTHVGEDWDYENTKMEEIIGWLMHRIEQNITEHIAVKFFDHDDEQCDQYRSEGMLAYDIDQLIEPYMVIEKLRGNV